MNKSAKFRIVSTTVPSKKAGGVAAFPAQLLGRLSLLEALVNGLGSGGLQDGVQGGFMKVAQGQVALVIQATGHHRAVAQHTDLVPQAIAEHPLAVISSTQIRPVEFVAVFQVDLLAQTGATALLGPGPGDKSRHGFQDLTVEFIGAEMPAPAEPTIVDLTTVGITGSYPTVDVPINAGSLGLTEGHVITLHYGSINLGEMDLSQYSKVTVTYATPCGVANGQDMNAEYEATGKRVLLLNAPSEIQAGSAFELLPAEDAIVTTAPYEISPTYSQIMTVEIDLTNVDYNGQLYLSFDFRNADNAFGALGYLVFVTDITFA